MREKTAGNPLFSVDLTTRIRHNDLAEGATTVRPTADGVVTFDLPEVEPIIRSAGRSPLDSCAVCPGVVTWSDFREESSGMDGVTSLAGKRVNSSQGEV